MGLRYCRGSSTIVYRRKNRPTKSLRYGRGFVTADVVIIEVHCILSLDFLFFFEMNRQPQIIPKIIIVVPTTFHIGEIS